MKKTVVLFVATFLVAVIMASCSLPPIQPVTRQELMQTRIYNHFIIEESPEELLYALNTRGEAIIEAKRNIPGQEFPIFLKLLATTDGIKVLDYDR